MSKKKFDFSIPRIMFWSNKIPNSRVCPRCNAKLKKEYSNYLIVTKKGNDYEYFVTGNDDGYFCPDCETVVLDFDAFTKLVSISSKFSTSLDFAVLGIVDIDAIPEDKKSLPIGDEDNPVPLVQFTNISNKSDSVKKRRRKKRKYS